MNDDELYAMRHSLAHIMAQAVTHLWPEAKLGVGPVIENGFYYDIDLGDTKISETDFTKIEKEMRNIIKNDYEFIRSERKIDEALTWAKDAKQIYKEELLNDLKRAGTTIAKELDSAELGLPGDGKSAVEQVSFYADGDFTDLCRGPHVLSTSKVGAFKLMRIAGVYWRGDEKRPQMQRLYGVAFASEKELDEYLVQLEELKKRDHRKISQELDLYTFSDLVGQGLPLWTPRGTILRNEVNKFVQELRDEYGYQEVAIPHITKKDLYMASGHWEKFKDELFRIKTREDHEFAMKPMNCPHHAQIYARKPQSYRDLPVRFRETTMVYRDEQSGELSGLSRVRSITQDDAHVFCRASQIEQEMSNIWDIVEKFWKIFGIELRVRLSLHDPENMQAYIGEESKWQSVETQLRKIIERRIGQNYVVGVGEAAFYGPKIDFIGKDVFGRDFQASTIQCDFGQPEGFDLTCINEKGEAERIVMVHAAIAGSLERCLMLLIEQTAGKFPVWMAPEQLRIIQVKDTPDVVNFVDRIRESAKSRKLRVMVDDSNESVGKKIRSAEIMKVPYTIVVGEKEVAEELLSPRVRSDLRDPMADEIQKYSVEQFIETIAAEVASRSKQSSL